VPGLFVIVTASCVPLLAAAAVGSALWLIPLWVVGGVLNGATNVYLMVIVAGRAPASAHGRAFAVVSASIQAAGLLGLMVAGPLVDRFEPRPLVAVAGAVGLLTSVACLVVVRRETPPVAVAPGRARDSVGA
jgi:MFS family permease